MDDGTTILWTIAGGAAMLFAVSVVAERRRTLRRDPDRVGWMPWTLVQLAATLALVCSVAMILTGRSVQ